MAWLFLSLVPLEARVASEAYKRPPYALPTRTKMRSSRPRARSVLDFKTRLTPAHTALSAHFPRLRALSARKAASADQGQFAKPCAPSKSSTQPLPPERCTRPKSTPLQTSTHPTASLLTSKVLWPRLLRRASQPTTETTRLGAQVRVLLFLR